MDYRHRDSLHPHRVKSLQILEKGLNYRVTMRVNRVMMIVIHTTHVAVSYLVFERISEVASTPLGRLQRSTHPHSCALLLKAYY